MKAANIMRDSRDEGIRLLAFEAIGNLSRSVTECREAIADEHWYSDTFREVVDFAKAGSVYLADDLREIVERHLYIVDARAELGEQYTRLDNDSRDVVLTVAVLIVRDLVGLPPRTAHPICAICKNEKKDACTKNSWHEPKQPVCFSCRYDHDEAKRLAAANGGAS